MLSDFLNISNQKKLYKNLIESIQMDRLNSVKELAPQIINLKKKGIENNQIALHEALKNDRSEIFEYLLNYYDNVEIKNKDGWNCWHLACLDFNKDNIKKLLEKNININSQTKSGYSCLHLMVFRLESNSPVVDWHPFYFYKIARYNIFCDILKELILLNMDLSLKDKDNKTFLDYIRNHLNKQRVLDLIEKTNSLKNLNLI